MTIILGSVPIDELSMTVRDVLIAIYRVSIDDTLLTDDRWLTLINIIVSKDVSGSYAVWIVEIRRVDRMLFTARIALRGLQFVVRQVINPCTVKKNHSSRLID